MKRFIFVLFLVFVSAKFSYSDGRPGISWSELLQKSETIALGRIIKVEEISPGQNKTFFEIQCVYKGEPSETISIEWSSNLDDKVRHIDTLNDQFLLFLRKTEDGKYCLNYECFMKRCDDALVNKEPFMYICDLPRELEKKMVVKEEYRYKMRTVKLKSIPFGAMLNWLHDHYEVVSLTE